MASQLITKLKIVILEFTYNVIDMLSEEFEKKHPNCDWDFHFDKDECYVGYPTIQIDFMLSRVVQFNVVSEV